MYSSKQFEQREKWSQVDLYTPERKTNKSVKTDKREYDYIRAQEFDDENVGSSGIEGSTGEKASFIKCSLCGARAYSQTTLLFLPTPAPLPLNTCT